MRRHYALLAAAAALIGVVAATVFKTIEVDNSVGWMFLGASLILIGQWTALEIIQSHKDEGE